MRSTETKQQSVERDGKSQSGKGSLESFFSLNHEVLSLVDLSLWKDKYYCANHRIQRSIAVAVIDKRALERSCQKLMP